jgi:hypothetical protein
MPKTLTHISLKKMYSKHIKSCSISNATRKMKMETMRYHYIPIRIVKTQNIDGQMLAKMWSSSNVQTLLTEMWYGIDTLEESVMISYKTKHTLTIWYITVFGIYQMELKSFIYTKIFIWVFIAIIFIILKTYNQYILVGKLISK